MQTKAASDITIDRFRAGDRQGVIDLILPIQRQEFGIAITPDDQPDLLDMASYYQTGLGDFWVARKGEDVVGTIGAKDIGDAQIALRKMFVAGSYRGRDFKVAARLLSTLLASARDRSVAEIYLGTTDLFLAAHRFYEKNGFVEISKHELPGRFPLMSVDTKFYRLRLAA